MANDSEGLSILAECMQCKAKFPVNAAVLVKHEYEGNGGQLIVVTCYDCPECGKRHFVQVDNVASKQMLAGVSKLFVQIATARHKGTGAIPVKKQEKYKKHKKYLDEYRMRLMREWSGKTVVDVWSGEIVVLEFAV